MRAYSAGSVSSPRPSLDDPVAMRPDQARDSCFDGLGPLGLVAENQDGLPQRRRLLLNAAGIGDDQVAASMAAMNSR
jgi:hypothetical protein